MYFLIFLIVITIKLLIQHLFNHVNLTTIQLQFTYIYRYVSASVENSGNTRKTNDCQIEQ